MKLIIISGLSGSGKTIALHVLEDLGFYCIDNLPLSLLQSFIQQLKQSKNTIDYVAAGIDARTLNISSSDITTIMQSLHEKGIDNEIIYLNANEDTLIKRFSETRRKHPLTDSATVLAEAIAKEKQLLLPLEQQANLQINTSGMSIYQLREKIQQHLSNTSLMHLQFLSFGFKHGLPHDADLVFDVRCLNNPYWVPALRSQTGKDARVQTFLSSHPDTNEVFTDICQFISRAIPRFEKNNRSYMTIAIGCTGGQHRSVYMVEQLSQYFSQRRQNILTRHRELQ